MMRIGIPREIKPQEGRVGLIPSACGQLVADGHSVLLERGAGCSSGYADEAYRAVGVGIVADAPSLYAGSQLVVKVKEPMGPELELLREEHLLFCYLHLAAAPALTRRLCEIGLTAVAFETVESEGRLPLLAPMSDIAGRIAIQAGTRLLYRPEGGRGVLLGGVPGVERGRVVVLGAGTAGESAVRVAAALGALVTVFDLKSERLAAMRAIGDNVTALYPYSDKVERELRAADLLVGAVLVPGARAPRLVSGEQVAEMAAGSVVVDISVDQGGCVETIRPTTWEEPTYQVGEVLHFGVANMPGAVPRTASQALSSAITPYLRVLAARPDTLSPELQKGVNLRGGRLCHPALIELFGGERWSG